MMRTAGNRRAGFTLIELLVVISIIAILLGLTTAAAQRVRGSMKEAEVKWQINQISQAADLFCVQESLGKPGNLPQGQFRLRENYLQSNGVVLVGYEAEAAYLKQIFPNLPLNATGIRTATTLDEVVLANGNEVAMFFLTGGEVTNYTGFSNNSQLPFSAAAPGEQRKGPFVQGLKQSMYAKTGTGRSQFVDPYGTPYVIFFGKRGNYGTQTASGVVPYTRGGKAEMPNSLQIISAGPNKLFGRGGDWSGGVSGDGADDLTNFSANRLGAGPQ